MKDNTAELKKALETALRLVPQDFTLQETMNHVRAALSSVQKVEKRRNQQVTRQQQMETFEAQKREKLGHPPIVRENPFVMSTNEARMVIKTLDQLIATEKKNLENILEAKNLKAKGGNPRTSGNTPIQTLLS